MILATSETISGHRVDRTLGLAYGAVIRSTGVHRGLIAFLKGLVGGEVEEYTKVLAEVREQALDRLREHAHAQGADAVIGLRFSSVEVAASAAEFIAYGTAVTLAADDDDAVRA